MFGKEREVGTLHWGRRPDGLGVTIRGTRLSAWHRNVSHKPHFILMPKFVSRWTDSGPHFSFCHPTATSHNGLSLPILNARPHPLTQFRGLSLLTVKSPAVETWFWLWGPRYTLERVESIGLSCSSEKVFVATEYSLQSDQLVHWIDSYHFRPYLFQAS